MAMAMTIVWEAVPVTVMWVVRDIWAVMYVRLRKVVGRSLVDADDATAELSLGFGVGIELESRD